MERRTFLFGLVGTVGIAAGGGAWLMNQPKFGRLPTGDRLARIQASPHFVNGKFQCLEPVEVMAKSESRIAAMIKFLTRDSKGLMPEQPMATKKTEIASLSRDEDVLVWLGHSSYYMQLGGWRVLMDPVFSDYGSPVFFVNRAFPGSNIYTAEDFPSVDVLAITHDHWDHLDYDSVMALRPKVRHVVCPLGVGEYFEQWGFDPAILHEEDWGEEISLAREFSVHILPSQHFSGRSLKENPTEWCAFAFTTSKRKVFVSGDGGYGAHFADIGKRFGGFDLAIMENGQYNESWRKIHMHPQETVQASEDVGARQVVTCHNGKFALALHPWQEPYIEMGKYSIGRPYEWLTPRIGETVRIGETGQGFSRWWEEMK